MTKTLKEDYPHYQECFFQTQLPGIIQNERDILFVRDPNNPDTIISMACLKKTSEEQKLCTLYVEEGFRKIGVETCLVEEFLKWLGTTKPLFTLANDKLDMFSKIRLEIY